MYDNQIKSASKNMNLSLVGICVCFTLLGVALGVLFNPALVQFIETLTKILK